MKAVAGFKFPERWAFIFNATRDDAWEDFGFNMCPAEPSPFVFYDGPATLIVVTSTDDFLCVYSHEDLF